MVLSISTKLYNHFTVLEHFHHPQNQPYNQPFLQGVWFLLLVNGVRNQDLGAGCACCYWGVCRCFYSLFRLVLSVSWVAHTYFQVLSVVNSRRYVYVVWPMYIPVSHYFGIYAQC